MSTDARDYDETEAHPDRAMSPSAMSSTRMEYDRGDKMVETFFEHNKSRSRSLYDLMTLFMMQYGPTASVSGVLREVQAQRLLGGHEHGGGGYSGHSSPVPQITTTVVPAGESEEESDVEQAPEPTPTPAKKKKPTPKTAAPKKTAPAPQPAPEPVEEKEEVTQSAPAPSAAAQALAADFFGDDEGGEAVTQAVVSEAPMEEESDTAEDAGAGTNTDTDEDEEEEDFFASMRR